MVSLDSSVSTDADVVDRTLDLVRSARMNFVVFRRDGEMPGEAAPLSRFLWQYVPEMAKAMGREIDKDEGLDPMFLKVSPHKMMEIAARDMEKSRPLVDWLGPHIPKDVQALFAKGSESALSPFMDAFARHSGVVRADSLALEEGRPEAVAEARRQDDRTAAFHAASMLGIGR